MFLSEKLRKNTKVILWITIFCFVGFIFLVWGMDVQKKSGRNPSVVGKINGQNIPTTYYRDLLTQAYDQARKQYGDRLTDAQEVSIRQTTWDRVVNEVLLQQQMRKRHIGATDAEVAYYIRNAPPPEVAQNPAFLTDGKFDPDKYRQILTNPAYDLSGLEAVVRSTIPMRKLEELVASNAKVSDGEVRQVFEQSNEKLNYSYVLVSPRSFRLNPDSIPAQELRSYYDQHKDEFKVPETAKLSYVIVEKRASGSDESDVLTSANDLWRELRSGTDFAELATTFSEGPEAKQGGDVGMLVAVNDLSPEFAKAASSLKIGEISSPFKDRKGFHIIRIEERKTESGVEKIRYRQILLPIAPSSQTLADIHKQVMDLVDNAKKASLDQVAKAAGLQAKETTPFAKDGICPILPQDAAVREFPFNNKVGAMGEPVETQRGWVVYQVAEKRPAYVPTFEEALRSIKMAVAGAKQDELAGRKIQEVAAAVARGETLERAAAGASLKVDKADSVAVYQVGSGPGKDAVMIGAALALPQGQVSTAIKGDEGYFVLRLDKRTPFDEQLFRAQRDQIRSQLVQQKRMIAASMWIDQIRKAARIEDYRAEVLGF